MRATIPVVLLAIAATGCGGEKLTSDEELAVADARLAFSNVIVDGSMYGRSLDSVDRIIRIYRSKPDALYDPDESEDGDELTMRQVLEDAASDLDRYQPDMAAELDRALSDQP